MRIESRWGLYPGIVLLALLAAGCASSARISQFETFAVAGTQYARAMDGLLTESTKVLVDTSSMKLLIPAEEARQEAAAIKKLPDSPEKTARAQALEAGLQVLDLKARLSESDAAIREHLEAIGHLRPQVGLLAAYFSQLAALATTDAPEQFGDQVKATAASLDELSSALKGSAVIGPKLADAAKGIGTMVVRGVQLKQLNRELEARKETIAALIRIHRELLDLIAAQVEHDRQISFAESYRQLVRQPLVDLTYVPDKWTATRRSMLMPTEVRLFVDSTRSALGNMETAWRKLLANELTLADVQAVVADLQPVLTALAR